MAHVADLDVCIDRWEAQVEVKTDAGWELHSPFQPLDNVKEPLRARSSAGVPPQGYISGEQARRACEGAEKRLCSRAEMRAACGGPQRTTYPYGNTRVPGACNEGGPVHGEFVQGGVPLTFSNMNAPHLNQQPNSLAPTGSKPECVSAYGAFDLVGNLHEWIDDEAGTFVGGFYSDAELHGSGCEYVTTAHLFQYHDYSTGFRCCR
jgi:formylglycine-generating enzyme